MNTVIHFVNEYKFPFIRQNEYIIKGPDVLDAVPIGEAAIRTWIVTNRRGGVKAYYMDSFGYGELPGGVKQRQDMAELGKKDNDIYDSLC